MTPSRMFTRKTCTLCDQDDVLHYIATRGQERQLQRSLGPAAPRDEHGPRRLVPHGNHIRGDRHRTALEGYLLATWVAPAGAQISVEVEGEPTVRTTTCSMPYRADDGYALIRVDVDGLEAPVRLTAVHVLTPEEILAEASAACVPEAEAPVPLRAPPEAAEALPTARARGAA